MAIDQRLFDGTRHVRSAQRAHGLIERLSQRPFAGTPEHPFERIVPQRDPAIAVDHRHTLFQQVEDLTTPVRPFEAAHVRGIGSICEDEQSCCNRQQSPHPVLDDFDQTDRDAGAKYVDGICAERRRRPRSIERSSHQERDNSFRNRDVSDVIADGGSRDRHRLPRPFELPGGPAKHSVDEAGTLDRDHHTDHVDERLATELC